MCIASVAHRSAALDDATMLVGAAICSSAARQRRVLDGARVRPLTRLPLSLVTLVNLLEQEAEDIIGHALHARNLLDERFVRLLLVLSKARL